MLAKRFRWAHIGIAFALALAAGVGLSRFMSPEVKFKLWLDVGHWYHEVFVYGAVEPYVDREREARWLRGARYWAIEDWHVKDGDPLAPLPPYYEADFRPNPVSLSELGQQTYAAIVAHQNPADCTTAKFWVANGDYTKPCCGMGSLAHRLTAGLAKAMTAGRILVTNVSRYGVGSGIADGPFCLSQFERTRGESGLGYSCYFVPLSTCTITPGAEAVPFEVSHDRDALPVSLAPALKAVGSHEQQLYFWRTHAVAYVMRLNTATAELLQRRRRGLERIGIPNVLPPGTVSIHVRHGDKWDEMRLMPFREYFDAAKSALEARGAPRPWTIFLSTDDPAVIKDAVAQTAVAGWDLLYVPFDRRVEGNLNARGDVVSLHALENILIHLQATHFVGTRGSNWNRLIDELRITWAGKAESEWPYISVGPGPYSGEGVGRRAEERYGW